MRYRIVPLEEFVGGGDPRIIDLCRLLAQRRVSQNIAQAAAWHLANGLSWQQLAAKERAGHDKLFTEDELLAALQLVEGLKR
jgi:hypothetical protein